MDKPILTRLTKLNIDKTVAILFVLILTSALLLIVINFYTFKTMSAVRAYVNGESEYSKGQKEALVYLLSYINIEDEKNWQLFKREISVPIADNNARHALYAHANDSIAASYLLAGRNHPDDIYDMVWLFKTFQHVSLLEKPISIWQNAEPLINRLNTAGDEIYANVQESKLTTAQKNAYIHEVNAISDRLSAMESSFSSSLGYSARRLRFYLFTLNVFFIILIITCIIVYAAKMIKRLAGYAERLTVKNDELTVTNKELDVFIFSASHDLRAPIASVKGLIDIAMQEDDKNTIKEYLLLVAGILGRQDDYIKEIIEFFKSKRGTIKFERIYIQDMAAQIFAQNQFMPSAKGIAFTIDITVDVFYSDALRIRTMLNNLISNAVKYSDKRKAHKQIILKAYYHGTNVIIEIEDNGIGIRKEHQEAIFELFFVTEKNEKNTGIGLYIVKQSVERLNGTITLESEPNIKTKFTITLPVEKTW